MDATTEMAFAKLALLKLFDFCRAQASTQEQQDLGATYLRPLSQRIGG